MTSFFKNPSSRGTAAAIAVALLLAVTFPAILSACSQKDSSQAASEFLKGKTAPRYGYRIVRSYDHDPDNFTEGLDLEDGILYEGTGLNGGSKLIKENLASGEILGTVNLDPVYFGEGVTLLAGEVFQLTYRSQIAFVYDAETLSLKRTFPYGGEGWGLTNDGESLIMSNGSSTISFLDGTGGNTARTIQVRDNQEPVDNLNELEYADGVIYANIWKQDVIAMISPESGEVEGWINLSGLRPAGTRDGSVLNGIAIDSASGNLLVTGKYWPSLFEIELVPA